MKVTVRSSHSIIQRRRFAYFPFFTKQTLKKTSFKIKNKKMNNCYPKLLCFV